MRKVALILLVISGLATAAGAQESCHRVAQTAILKAIRGETITREELRGCWGTLREIRGSENIPVLTTAAAIVEGLQDPRDLAPLLRGKAPWPPGEICSPIYGSWIALGVLTVHNRAEMPRPVRRATRRYLRAFWTLLTLTAVFEEPSRLEILRPGEAPQTLPATGGHRTRVSLHCPGMRAAERGTDYWTMRSDLLPFYAAAMGLPWQPRRALAAKTVLGEPQWSLSALQELAGGDLRTVDVEFWGLEVKERRMLRGFLAAPSLDLARQLRPWLAPLRPPEGLVRTVIRFERGILSAQSFETNAVKRTQEGYTLAAFRPDGTAVRVAARKTRVLDDRVRAFTGSKGLEVEPAPFGREVFRLVGTSARWQVLAPYSNPSTGETP